MFSHENRIRQVLFLVDSSQGKSIESTKSRDTNRMQIEFCRFTQLGKSWLGKVRILSSYPCLLQTFAPCVRVAQLQMRAVGDPLPVINMDHIITTTNTTLRQHIEPRLTCWILLIELCYKVTAVNFFLRTILAHSQEV